MRVFLIMRKFFLNFMVLPFVRFKTKRGYGVHSPFVFHFIVEILNCDYHYYAFSELDILRESLVAEFRIKPLAYYHLLYRLSNYLNPSRIISVGNNNSTILSSFYLTAPKSDIRTCVLDATLNPNISIEFSESPLFKRISFFERITHLSDINRFMCGINAIDILYLSKGNNLKVDLWDFLTICFTKVHNDSLLIIEDISSSDKAALLWDKIRESPNTTVTIDMKSFGFAFFSDKLYKKNYKLYL